MSLTRRMSEDDLLLRSAKENIPSFNPSLEVNKDHDVWERASPVAKKPCLQQQQTRFSEWGEATIVASPIADDETRPKDPIQYSFSDLKGFTNGFCDANLIGKFQFGKVYHGCIGTKAVIVKKWENSEIYWYCSGDNEARLHVEMDLLRLPKWSRLPNLPKLIGYCREGEEKMGIIYDLNPLDSLYNLIQKDSFTWLERIKVIIRFAQLLVFMHTDDPPHSCYIIRNIDAAHLMLDKDYNPILIDFSMVSGGIVPDRDLHDQLNGCYDYIDPDTVEAGFYSEDTDIFSFGILLMLLISKRHYAEERLSCPVIPCTYMWALDEYDDKVSNSNDMATFSLVHESLQISEDFYPSDGYKLTVLARECVKRKYWERPAMEEVVKQLQKLEIVRSNAGF